MKLSILSVGLICLTPLLGCRESFLEIEPQGTLNEFVFASETGLDGLLIGAYAMLDGVSAQQFGWETASSNWVYGSIRGMIANHGSQRGGGSPILSIQNFSEQSTHVYLDLKWRSFYEAIARSNAVIRVANLALERRAITEAQYQLIVGQARGLRGHYHADAWRLFRLIPYMDEQSDPLLVGNSEDIRDRILADLSAGAELPNNMGQIGRFNGTVCKVLLAKAYLQMYQDYTAAKPLLQAVIDSGTKPDGSEIGPGTPLRRYI